MEAPVGVTSSASPSPRRLLWRTALRIFLALVLLAVLLLFVEPEQIISAFSSADPGPISAAALLLIANVGFQVLKWHYLLVVSDARFPFSSVARSFFFGITAGTLTPGQIGEFGGRAFHLTTDNPAKIVGLTIVDKLQMLAVMAIGGSISLIPLFDLGLFTGIPICLACASIVMFLFRPSLLARALEKTGLGRVRNRWVVEFLAAVGSIRRPQTIAVTTAMTVFFYATIWIQLHFLLNAFTTVSFVDSYLGFAAMMFVKSVLPVTFADLGVREIGLVYFMSLRLVPEAASFNAGILLFAINVLAPALVGLLFIPRSFSLGSQQ